MRGPEFPFQIGCSGYTSLRDLFRALKEAGKFTGGPGEGCPKQGQGHAKAQVGLEWEREYGCGEVRF